MGRIRIGLGSGSWLWLGLWAGARCGLGSVMESFSRKQTQTLGVSTRFKELSVLMTVSLIIIDDNRWLCDLLYLICNAYR